MDVKRQLIFAVINIFLSKSCIVCEDCQCEGLVNILKRTMSMEIFDLKMQNGMLQARMDKLESMLQGKSSSTPTQDITGLDAFEERLDSVESNMQQAIVISKKALKLNAIISKGLQSEKKERIQLVSKSERQIHHLNGSVTDLKFTITNALQDNLTKIGDDIEKMEHLMKDSVMDVKNDVKIFQYNMSELQSQTNALIVYNITDLEFNLAVVSRKFRKNIAELDHQMNTRLLDIKHENAEVIRNVTKLQNVTNEIVGKSIANLKSSVVAIDKNILEMKADINSLPDTSFLLNIECPELPSVKNGEILQNTREGFRNKFGSVSEITCNTGYYLDGNVDMKVYKRQCQADGTWNGTQPVCGEPKCRDYSQTFYGGHVTYFGHRTPHSFALHRCYGDTSLYPPSHVSYSRCEQTFKWSPEPPQCLKRAKVVVPNNGHVCERKRAVIIEHSESYSVCCDDGYKLYDDGFLGVKSIQIKNNNGTLTPEVPQCIKG